MTSIPEDPRLQDARDLAAAWIQSRASASPVMRELVFSRVGLCHAVFDMLQILPPDGMEEFFTKGEN